MSDPAYLVEMTTGVPVVSGPAEIDATTAGRPRTALLQAAARGHATVVADMTRTRSCDSAGLSVLIRAHRRALEESAGRPRDRGTGLADLGRAMAFAVFESRPAW